MTSYDANFVKPGSSKGNKPRRSRSHAQGFKAVRKAHQSEIVEDYVELIADLIKKYGEARTVEIARHMGVTQPTVVKNLSRLQRDGFITREQRGNSRGASVHTFNKQVTTWRHGGVKVDSALPTPKEAVSGLHSTPKKGIEIKELGGRPCVCRVSWRFETAGNGLRPEPKSRGGGVALTRVVGPWLN